MKTKDEIWRNVDYSKYEVPVLLPWPEADKQLLERLQAAFTEDGQTAVYRLPGTCDWEHHNAVVALGVIAPGAPLAPLEAELYEAFTIQSANHELRSRYYPDYGIFHAAIALQALRNFGPHIFVA